MTPSAYVRRALAAGYNIIGEGSYAVVLARPGETTCRRVRYFDGKAAFYPLTEADAWCTYMDWAEGCFSNFAPRRHAQETFMVDPTDPADRAEGWVTDAVMFWSVDHIDRLAMTTQDCLDMPEAEWQHRHAIHQLACDAIETWGDENFILRDMTARERALGIRGLVSFCRCFHHAFKGRFFFDLHFENTMWTRDGHLVITDPLAPKDQPSMPLGSTRLADAA